MLKLIPIVYSDFLLKNLWWIVLIALALLFLAFFFIEHRSKLIKRKKKSEVTNEKASLYLEALGGENNVEEKKLEGSRIVVKLKDYNAVNRDKLREAGVSGFIQMSDRLTLVIKENAAEVYNKIFPNA